MSERIAVYLREQVEDGVSVFAANSVAEFDAVEAQRLMDNGVAVLAADMAMPAVTTEAAEQLATQLATLTQAHADLQASHDALSENASAANAEIDRLTRELAAANKKAGARA